MEKINIYVPKEVGKTLERDAELFEIYKSDGLKINKNRFLSMLIQGYYKDYHDSEKKNYDLIMSVLEKNGITKSKRTDIASEIYNKLLVPEIPSRKGKDPKKLSLKPTYATEPLIEQILEDIGAEDFISQYFCKLLSSYCNKPFSIREQIVFHENYRMLQNYCETGQSIAVRTKWDAKSHRVIPYKVVVGQDEMFNYLLCAEENSEAGTQEPKVIRLCRIEGITTTQNMGTIDEKCLHFLKMMEEKGPQYIIKDETESCVRLTKGGRIQFCRIYHGRPTPSRVEEKDGIYYYYFDCSKYQLFLYFRRFEYGAAEILEPQSLREKMMEFHLKAYEIYLDERK